MYIADLHIHSKYSRATSKELEPEPLDAWARRKGIGLVGTGDFTHPAWRAELRDKLAEAEEGLYTLKGAGPDAPRFVITGEISSIYKKNGKVRKVTRTPSRGQRKNKKIFHSTAGMLYCGNWKFG